MWLTLTTFPSCSSVSSIGEVTLPEHGNSGWFGDEGRRTGIWTVFGNVADAGELAERERQTKSRRYSN
jgi:hypothetical protein